MTPQKSGDTTPAIQHRSWFNVIHLATMFKVDIFILKADIALQEKIRWREPYQVSESPEQTLLLASAEDVIVQKLYWYQSSKPSLEQHWRDVSGVLQVQKE